MVSVILFGDWETQGNKAPNLLSDVSLAGLTFTDVTFTVQIHCTQRLRPFGEMPITICGNAHYIITKCPLCNGHVPVCVSGAQASFHKSRWAAQVVHA